MTELPPIRYATKHVFTVGQKKYFSLIGACRHRARIKIAKRLGEYFREQGKIDAQNAPASDAGYGFNYTHQAWEEEYYPSKVRYKLMRERLARTMLRKYREAIR